MCVCVCVCVCDDLYPVKESRGIKVKEKSREFQKNMYLCFTDYAKTFDCVDHNKLWKLLKRWEYQTILPVS